MKNIGEKLEQARNARGLTLKDVVAYTKIKQEFLVSMEKNDFSFNLPDVYRRGFLRLYSDYLKLDTQEIMKEYKAMQGDVANSSPINILEKLSEDESKLREEALSNAVEAEVLDTTERFEADKDYFDAPPAPLECDSKYNYLKIGLICSSVFFAVLILFFLIRAVSSSESDNASFEDNISIVSPVADSFVLTLSTKPNQDTYIALYYQGQENQPIYAGALSAGDSKDFEIKSSGALLNVSDVERLRLFKNSTEFSISASLKGPKIFNVTAP